MTKQQLEEAIRIKASRSGLSNEEIAEVLAVLRDEFQMLADDEE